MCVCVWVGPLQGHHPQEGLQRYTAHLGRGGGACVCVCVGGTAPRTSPTGRPAKVHCSLREGRGGVCVCVCGWDRSKDITHRKACKGTLLTSGRWGGGGGCVCVVCCVCVCVCVCSVCVCAILLSVLCCLCVWLAGWLCVCAQCSVQRS